MASIYEEGIIRATGCSKEDAAQIEDIMRHDIFHSTLDWIPPDQFDKAAREAAALLPGQKLLRAMLAKEGPASTLQKLQSGDRGGADGLKKLGAASPVRAPKKRGNGRER